LLRRKVDTSSYPFKTKKLYQKWLQYLEITVITTSYE
jgi:hypothetical protein